MINDQSSVEALEGFPLHSVASTFRRASSCELGDHARLDLLAVNIEQETCSTLDTCPNLVGAVKQNERPEERPSTD